MSGISTAEAPLMYNIPLHAYNDSIRPPATSVSSTQPSGIPTGSLLPVAGPLAPGCPIARASSSRRMQRPLRVGHDLVQADLMHCWCI